VKNADGNRPSAPGVRAEVVRTGFDQNRGKAHKMATG
jgi:hypothetical protein